MYRTSFLVLPPLFWLCRAGFGCFLGKWRAVCPMASIFSATFGDFSPACWCYIHFFWLCRTSFGCFLGDDSLCVQWQAFTQRLLDVSCQLPGVSSTYLALPGKFWMFSGEWRFVRPMAGLYSAAFGRFVPASWCYIHFSGFAGQVLDVFRGMADCTSNGKHFLSDFWMFRSNL